MPNIMKFFYKTRDKGYFNNIGGPGPGAKRAYRIRHALFICSVLSIIAAGQPCGLLYYDRDHLSPVIDDYFNEVGALGQLTQVQPIYIIAYQGREQPDPIAVYHRNGGRTLRNLRE